MRFPFLASTTGLVLFALTAGPAIGQTAKSCARREKLDAAEDAVGRSGYAGDMDR